MDLKKELENLLPINKDKLEQIDNPRSRHNVRRPSKSFRQFPQIVVHPPESEPNLTKSMPDIHAFLVKQSHNKNINNVSEQNVSCPDLTDETFFNEFDDVFEDYDDCSESISVCSESSVSRTRRVNMFACPDPQIVPSKDIKNKYASAIPKKTKIESPSEMLKRNWRSKHSTSMHSLPKYGTSDMSFDNYYTIHGERNFSHHTPWSYGHPHPSHHYFGNHCCNENVMYFPPGVRDGPMYTRSYSSTIPYSNPMFFNMAATQTTEVVHKCCCGGVNCKSVVPIHEYLERYFNETVRNFTTHKRKINSCGLGGTQYIYTLHIRNVMSMNSAF